MQVYVKLNTADNLRNGIFRFWLDGIKVFDLANVDYRNSTSDTLRKVLPLSMHGGDHSPPGSFGWQLDEVELWDGLPTGAPRVNRVFVRGRDWAPALLNHIADRALGDRDFGYQIGEGAAQLDELPWTNVNQIAIRFDNVTQVGRADLRVLGVNVAAREITGFRYDGRTRTAQWTLRNPVSADRLTLALNTTRVNRAGSLLDGEWADGSDAYPSGNGSPGGAFNFRLNVLPGDATRDGRVNALDVAEVKRRLGRRPNDGASGYSIFADVTADGVINALDLGAIKQRLGRNLPVGSAAAATSVLLRDERVQSEMERIACFVPVA